MSERASIFEAVEDFDLSKFKPKPATKATENPAPEAIRAVSENANFVSREPAKAKPAKVKREQLRRRRTGRSLQLNIKVAEKPLELFYAISDSHGWVLGETFERAIEALKRELEDKAKKS